MSSLDVQTSNNAIVIGASMSGLLAGRALANHFDQVTLVERDVLPARGENRKGVPQGKQTHVLLERGRKVMEKYLPGLTDALADLGAVTVADASRNLRWFHGSDYHAPGRAGFSGIAVSRPTLEAAVRERVRDLSNVRIVEGCSVQGLEAKPAEQPAPSHKVSGVRVVHRRDGNRRDTMDAALVVDAGGRGSRSPAWLEELGYERPPEEEVHVGIGYVTRYYRRQPEHLQGIEGIVLMAAPPSTRLGFLMAQDGQRWALTVAGYLGDHAPTDPTGFLEAVRQLPSSDIYDVVKRAEPLGQPTAYKFPANSRHHYDRLPAFPRGYLVIGDALCSFNPTYGQGMTVAALEAAALDACLADGRAGLAQRFFDRANEIVDDPWRTAVWGDLSFSGVEGRRTPLIHFFHWYMDRLQAAARRDARVSIAFIKVINMLAPPLSVLHPRIAWRVLKGAV